MNLTKNLFTVVEEIGFSKIFYKAQMYTSKANSKRSTNYKVLTYTKTQTLKYIVYMYIQVTKIVINTSLVAITAFAYRARV